MMMLIEYLSAVASYNGSTMRLLPGNSVALVEGIPWATSTVHLPYYSSILL